MLILPYSTALRLNQIPYVTFTIMVLCLAIFFFQIQNRNVINNTAQLYCELIKNTEPEDHTYDVIPQDNEYCLTILLSMHSFRDIKEWRSYFLEYYTADDDLEKYITYDLKHYSEFVAKGVPTDLDTKLMYYPFSFNPFKMLTSALSHSDWAHIIFNLIFFFAFTPTIEILVGNKLKFIAVLVSIELIGGIMYSISSLINNSPIPTLGLSGSVMGMIGFSAYMMPKASIRTVFWFSFFIRKLFIPVWVLAIWYIGWDIFDLFIRTENGGSTNFVAHISGGISGYLIARFFFKDRRELIQEELDDEIDRSRASREDTFSRMTSFIGDRKRIDHEVQEHQTKKDQAVFIDRLYKMVNTGNSSDAMMYLLNTIEMSPVTHDEFEKLEQLLDEIACWKKKRSYFCIARLLINAYIDIRKFGMAFTVINKCLEADSDFLLPDASKVILLANEALNQQQFELVYRIIRNFKIRYNDNGSCVDHVILEAQVLWFHLNRREDAIALLNKAINRVGTIDANKLQSVLDALEG